MSGQLRKRHLPDLYEKVCVLLRDEPVDEVICDLHAIAQPDAVAVDALAKLRLVTAQSQIPLTLVRVPDALRELLTFTGICEVMLMEEGQSSNSSGRPNRGNNR